MKYNKVLENCSIERLLHTFLNEPVLRDVLERWGYFHRLLDILFITDHMTKNGRYKFPAKVFERILLYKLNNKARLRDKTGARFNFLILKDASDQVL